MEYIAYYRTSKDTFKMGRSRSSGLGLEAQKAIVTRFYSIKDEYIEVKSAKNITERPILQEAIKYCLDNNCGLVVARIDRLSRDVDDCRLILKQLEGKLFSCDIPGALDKFTLTLFALIAERERELTSIRTSQALQAKIKRDGPWQKGNKAFSTPAVRKASKDAIKAKAATNPNNIRARSYIAELLTNGLNYVQIANKLNENSYKTSRNCTFKPMQVKRLASVEI